MMSDRDREDLNRKLGRDALGRRMFLDMHGNKPVVIERDAYGRRMRTREKLKRDKSDSGTCTDCD